MSDLPSSLDRYRFPLLRSLHWAASQGMKRAGYRWEPRRTGELQLGFWRKRFKPEGSGSKATARRFVMIPGFGDTPMSWLLVLGLLRGVLQKNFDEIILVDFPGYGGFLARERPFHSMELLKATLFDALDSLAPSAILGHSLGGWLAALYAAECGEGLRNKRPASGGAYGGPELLVLADASGVFEDEGARDELMRKFRVAIQHKHQAIEYIRPHIFAREPMWFRFLAGEFSRFFLSPEIAQFVDSFKEEHLLEPHLRKIRSRVWLIWGEHDTLVPARNLATWMKGLKECAPFCKAVVLKRAGHSPQIETPGRLAAVLGRILATGTAGAENGADAILGHRLARRWWELVES